VTFHLGSIARENLAFFVGSAVAEQVDRSVKKPGALLNGR